MILEITSSLTEKEKYIIWEKREGESQLGKRKSFLVNVKPIIILLSTVLTIVLTHTHYTHTV